MLIQHTGHLEETFRLAVRRDGLLWNQCGQQTVRPDRARCSQKGPGEWKFTWVQSILALCFLSCFLFWGVITFPYREGSGDLWSYFQERLWAGSGTGVLGFAEVQIGEVFVLSLFDVWIWPAAPPHALCAGSKSVWSCALLVVLISWSECSFTVMLLCEKVSCFRSGW